MRCVTSRARSWFASERLCAVDTRTLDQLEPPVTMEWLTLRRRPPVSPQTARGSSLSSLSVYMSPTAAGSTLAAARLAK